MVIINQNLKFFTHHVFKKVDQKKINFLIFKSFCGKLTKKGEKLTAFNLVFRIFLNLRTIYFNIVRKEELQLLKYLQSISLKLNKATRKVLTLNIKSRKNLNNLKKFAKALLEYLKKKKDKNFLKFIKKLRKLKKNKKIKKTLININYQKNKLKNKKIKIKNEILESEETDLLQKLKKRLKLDYLNFKLLLQKKKKNININFIKKKLDFLNLKNLKKNELNFLEKTDLLLKPILTNIEEKNEKIFKKKPLKIAIQKEVYYYTLLDEIYSLKKKKIFALNYKKKVLNLTKLFTNLTLNLNKFVLNYQIELQNSVGLSDGALGFFNCIKLLLPLVKIIKKTQSATLYELPRPLINLRNSLSIAMKNLINSSLKRKEKSLINKLTVEIMQTLKKKSLSYFNKLDVYRLAVKGKPFLHLLNFKQYRLKYTTRKSFFKKVVQRKNRNLSIFEKKHTFFSNIRKSLKNNLKYYKNYKVKKKKRKKFKKLVKFKKSTEFNYFNYYKKKNSEQSEDQHENTETGEKIDINLLNSLNKLNKVKKNLNLNNANTLNNLLPSFETVIKLKKLELIYLKNKKVEDEKIALQKKDLLKLRKKNFDLNLRKTMNFFNNLKRITDLTKKLAEEEKTPNFTNFDFFFGKDFKFKALKTEEKLSNSIFFFIKKEIIDKKLKIAEKLKLKNTKKKVSFKNLNNLFKVLIYLKKKKESLNNPDSFLNNINNNQVLENYVFLKKKIQPISEKFKHNSFNLNHHNTNKKNVNYKTLFYRLNLNKGYRIFNHEPKPTKKFGKYIKQKTLFVSN